MQQTFGHTQLILEGGDITKQRADALVNAANPALRGGGGVDGAIHRAGGHAISSECGKIIREIGRLAPGMAVATTAGRLPAQYVIHTVGPIWHGGQSREASILASAYRESLRLADKLAVKSIAFPSLATGVYGYPVAQAATVALETVRDYLQGETRIEKVVFVLFSREDLDAYGAALTGLKP